MHTRTPHSSRGKPPAARPSQAGGRSTELGTQLTTIAHRQEGRQGQKQVFGFCFNELQRCYVSRASGRAGAEPVGAQEAVSRGKPREQRPSKQPPLFLSANGYTQSSGSAGPASQGAQEDVYRHLGWSNAVFLDIFRL